MVNRIIITVNLILYSSGLWKYYSKLAIKHFRTEEIKNDNSKKYSFCLQFLLSSNIRVTTTKIFLALNVCFDLLLCLKHRCHCTSRKYYLHFVILQRSLFWSSDTNVSLAAILHARFSLMSTYNAIDELHSRSYHDS